MGKVRKGRWSRLTSNGKYSKLELNARKNNRSKKQPRNSHTRNKYPEFESVETGSSHGKENLEKNGLNFRTPSPFQKSSQRIKRSLYFTKNQKRGKAKVQRSKKKGAENSHLNGLKRQTIRENRSTLMGLEQKREYKIRQNSLDDSRNSIEFEQFEKDVANEESDNSLTDTIGRMKTREKQRNPFSTSRAIFGKIDPKACQTYGYRFKDSHLRGPYHYKNNRLYGKQIHLFGLILYFYGLYLVFNFSFRWNEWSQVSLQRQ